jgi:hypothetical protein
MATTKVTSSVLADDAVATAAIADDAVTTAKISDDAVTAAKIADGAIDAAAKLGTGVVTSAAILDGTIALGDLAAALSMRVLLDTQTASASASLDLTTGIDSTYDRYELEIVDLVPATDAVSLYLRVSTDGGSTYKSGASDYDWAHVRVGAGAATATSGNEYGSGNAFIRPSGSGSQGLGNAATDAAYNGLIRFTSPDDAARAQQFQYDVVYGGADGNTRRLMGSGMYRAATAVNGLRLLMSSGNIASGYAKLYGVRL